MKTANKSVKLNSHNILKSLCTRSHTKLGTNSQAMPMARHRRKTLISMEVEVRVFCLLRRCPNPRRTQFCVLETVENSSGYAILQIAGGRSTPALFRFSLCGERIVPKNPIHISLGSLQGAHILPGLLVICVHDFFLR